MKPTIETSDKGQVLVKNRSIDYDFYINPEGEIVRRAKAASIASGDDPHTISLFEAGELYDPNINEMIIGCDNEDKILLSNEATDFFEEKKCKIKLLPLQEAITYWNNYEGHAVGLFHISKR